jgi:hypothetical protein
MDSLLVQSIDEMLVQKLPTKSSMSSAEWVINYPQSTSSLDANGSNVLRFSLSKYPNGYLCATKGGLTPYFQFTLSAFTANGNASRFIAEPWGVFKQMKLYLNGVEISNVQYSHHLYAEWLKKKSSEWLRTDGGNFGLPEGSALPWTALPISERTAGGVNLPMKYTLPLPDNFSLFSKNHALPLSSLDITIECTLNEFGKFCTGIDDVLAPGTAPQALAKVQVSNVSLMLPISHIDNEIHEAIMAKLEAGDMDESEMFLLPIENVRIDAQTHNFVGDATKSFIWNTVSSSVRFLELVVSTDTNDSSDFSYKTTSAFNCGILNYIFRVDGKNVSQSSITTAANGYDQAYQHRNDLTSAYNYINNEQAYQMGSINKTRFNDLSVAPPAWNAPLASSFSAVAILDTVSRDNVISGSKIINNLQTELQYAGANLPNANVYLIQHSNAIVAFSKTKAKLLM